MGRRALDLPAAAAARIEAYLEHEQALFFDDD